MTKRDDNVPLLLAAAGAVATGFWFLTRSESGGSIFTDSFYPDNETKWVVGYKNKLPFPLLVKSVGNQAWLAEAAADAFLQMQEMAGWDGIKLLAGSGFRDMLTQTGLYVKWKVGLYNVPSVAVPGTSNHQSGSAVDVAKAGNKGSITIDSPEFKWLTDNANYFGFSWDEGSSVNEPWHWRYTR